MTWFRAGGGGIPASLKNGMNAVLNKKFGTSGQTYAPSDWPDDVNLLGKLPEKTASGALVNITDGADEVPLKDLIFSASPIQAEGTPSPSNPLPISGHTEMNGVHCGKNLLNADKSQTIVRDKTIQCSLKAGTYTMSFDLISTTADPSPSYLQVAYATDDGTKYNPVTIPSSGKCTRTFTFAFDSPRFTIYASESYASSVGVTTIIDNFMIEVGSSASTSFAPYSAETKKWSFPPFGKNQWNEKWEVGSISTSTGENTVDNNVLRSKDYISVTPNATMTWSCGSNASAIYSFFGYDSNKTFVGTISNTKPFTIPSNVYFIRFRLYAVYGTTYLNDIQIEVGSTATSYEPYQSMFAGSVNALTGEVESSKKLVVFTGASNENWTSEQISGLYRFRIVLSDVKISSAGRNEVMSNIGHFTTANEYNAIFAYQSQQAKVLYYYPPQGIETVEDFKTWLTSNNLQVCYDLADPIEIDMDSVDWQTQLGDNNFFNDCGDTEVTYRADIDLALAQLSGTRGLMMASRSVSPMIGEEASLDRENILEEVSENMDNEESEEER